MRIALSIIFVTILLAMLAITGYASWNRSILAAGGELLADPWFLATLVDAYCGFLTFYVWVAYKESSGGARLVWFVLIMGLGNIAMSVYVLIQLARLRPGDGWESLLLRRPAELSR